MANVFDSSKMSKADGIINDSIRKFIDRINAIAQIGPNTKYRHNTPGFPMLKPGNSEFYQYAHYEGTLEWYIRDMLVNAVFRELFIIFDIESLWPDTSGTICVRFDNESIERVYPMEFILRTSGKRVGYRYTSLCDNEAEEYLSEYNLDHIVILDWSDSESMLFSTKRLGYNNVSVYSESVRHFYTTLFTDELYRIYYAKILDAVRIANEEIGFQTIPRLSLRYLSSFKDDLETTMSSLDYRVLRYTVLDSKIPEDDKLHMMFLSNEDYDILDMHFLKQKRYRALLGTAQFAKCFITAEYLFNIFDEGNSFDYTSVVCGYMKSIEQLLYLIMRCLLSTLGDNDLWIRCINPKFIPKAVIIRKHPKHNNIQQVSFKPQNEAYFNTELGSLIYFIHDSDKLIISSPGKELIHRFLLQYAGECRNDHFHKDNIEAYHDVVTIRNDTFLLMYLLLGSISLSGDESEVNRVLGITDDSFNRMYKKLIEIPKSVNRFILQYAGQREMRLRRMFSQDKPAYDEFGSQSTSTIRFISEEKYALLTDEENVTPDYVIDRSNVPEKIWIVKHGGERVELKW